MRSLPSNAQPLLHSRDAHQGVHTAARVLSFRVTAPHGQELWCGGGVYGQVERTGEGGGLGRRVRECRGLGKSNETDWGGG